MATKKNLKTSHEPATPRSKRDTGVLAKKTDESLLLTDWTSVEARPAATVRDCMFYLLGLRPQAARRTAIHERGSDHPLSRSYDTLLRVTALQIIARNPCMKPLLGKPTRDRDEVEAIWLSLAHFVALVKSPLSPYEGLIEPPEALRSLLPSPSFADGHQSPSEALATYEKAARKRRPNPLSIADLQDVSDVFSDSILPLPQDKGERYAYPTIGLLAELLEEVARGRQEPTSFLHRGDLDAERVGKILDSLATARFPASHASLRKPSTMAKHINNARNRLKNGDFD